MAGTVTATEKTYPSVKKITWAWTSTAGGLADLVTTLPYDGKLIGLGTDPGAGPPSPNYDITITDADGHDVLLGAGANRHTTTTEYVDGTNIGGVSDSVLTLNVSGTGGVSSGVVILWIR